MADIFFSYESDERERVAPIVAGLEAEGWSVFWDRKTPVGLKWSEYIRQNLVSSGCVVVAWSEASVESHWVEIEAGKGRDRGCLVPLRLDDVAPPFGFEHIQAADFTHWAGDPGSDEWQSLVAAIERHVPRGTDPTAGPNAASQPDLSKYWERLLAAPSLGELEQLTEEVAALRQAHPVNPGLIKLQRSVAGARDAAERSDAARPVSPAPLRYGGPRVWAWVAAGIVALASALILIRMGPEDAASNRPTDTGGQTAVPAPEPVSKPKPAVTRIDTGKGPTALEPRADIPLPRLVEIPEGCFRMGSPEGAGDNNERPQHRVCLERFYIGRHEVTFDQYDAFVRARGRERPDDKGWGRGNRPVINVSWHDAQDYVQWLSQETGVTCALPSEAQWEYAARAGTSMNYALPAPKGSDDIRGKGLANCGGCGSRWDGRQTAPVGSFPANAWDLYDMHGNVWEWVRDRYHPNYEGAPTDGAAWEDRENDSATRVLRGGSWGGSPVDARASLRFRGPPDYRLSLVGFRVLCSSPIRR